MWLFSMLPLKSRDQVIKKHKVMDSIMQTTRVVCHKPYKSILQVKKLSVRKVDIEGDPVNKG